jgi:hypothetical protein
MKIGERRARAVLTVDVLVTAEAAGQRRSGRSDSDGRLQPGRRRGRDGRDEVVRTAAAARSEQHCRDVDARFRQRF